VSHEAVTWAMDDAPMLLTDKGKPDTTSRHVLQVLAEHAHPNGGGARPSVMRIQYRSGYDRRTVQRALRRLEDGNLITPEGVVNGCTVYRLALKLKRPASDWAGLEAEEVRQRDADAERQRRSRAKRVTHSDDVTVTDAESVTDLDCHALSVPTSRTQNPDVTDGTPPEPSVEPPGEPSLSPRVPQPTAEEPPAPASERETIAALDKTTKRLTAAQKAVRGIVPLEDEPAFIAWITAKHQPDGPGWWRTVARNGDFHDHADTWRADRAATVQQRASPALPRWCTHCGDGFPAEHNAKFRTTNGKPCKACHPDHVKDTAA
jgi:hypothetical protein